jgi:hypothetical protein
MPYTKILETLKIYITSSKIKKLSNVTDRIFETLNNMEMGVNISFENFLLILNLDLSTYIDSLCNKLTKPSLFLKREVKGIKTNIIL